MVRGKRKVLGDLREAKNAAMLPPATRPAKGTTDTTTSTDVENEVTHGTLPDPPDSLDSSSSVISGSSRSQSSVSVYRCRHCQLVFSQKSLFVTHKRTEHADELTHITGTPSSVFSGHVIPESTIQDLLEETEVVTTDPGNDGTCDGPVTRFKKQKLMALTGRNKMPWQIGQQTMLSATEDEDEDETDAQDRNPKLNGG